MSRPRCRHILLATLLFAAPPARAETPVPPSEVRAIAKEAYVYGFPLVDNYRVLYAYNVDRSNPEFKGPWNEIQSAARVYTPDDKTVQTPNSDTPYSFVSLDLRTEPMVLTVPGIEKERYFSVQLVDLYTHNFAYLGSRTTGNDGGSFLVAGPGWKGAAPAGVRAVIQSETEIVLAIYRTQLFGPADLEHVKAIQGGYTVTPLSRFTKAAAPAAAPEIEFVRPLSTTDERTLPEFFDRLAFVLQFCPTHPSEDALRARFAKIGIVPGERLVPKQLAEETRTALAAGMADGQKEIEARRAAGHASADLFGTREFLKNDYVNRAAAAQAGIYGNSKDEAFYVMDRKDAKGKALDGEQGRYTLRFAPGALPPANAFWSLTMYELPAQLLAANPLGRYLVNSPMLPALKRDADGGITIFIQHESPGEADEANWLPAPAGPFLVVTRIYWPKPEVLDGRWTAPSLQPVR